MILYVYINIFTTNDKRIILNEAVQQKLLTRLFLLTSLSWQCNLFLIGFYYAAFLIRIILSTFSFLNVFLFTFSLLRWVVVERLRGSFIISFFLWCFYYWHFLIMVFLFSTFSCWSLVVQIIFLWRSSFCTFLWWYSY